MGVSSTLLPEWVWNLFVAFQCLPHVWGRTGEGRYRDNRGGLK